MPKIKFSEIQTLKSDDAVKLWLRETLDKFSPDDPPLLSDCIANYHVGAAPFIVHLAADDEERAHRNLDRFRWKIEVLCDEWGQKVKPGDIVQRQHKRSFSYKPGRPIPGSELSAMKMDGRYEEELIYYTPFVVDDKGCIDCGFHDAMNFLSLYGVHPNGRKLTSKQPTNKSPVYDEMNPDAPPKHVHYLRYKEADKHRYSQMPKIKKSQNRGELQE
jgi:hypothetical protein